MKKLGLVAAAAAVLALAGCNNGAQEVVNVTQITSENYYDVSGSYVEKLSYTDLDGTKVTRETSYTASDKSFAIVSWTDDESIDTNRKTYTISIQGLSYTLKVQDGVKDGKPTYKDVTYDSGKMTYKIAKVSDEFFLGDALSRFAGNDALGITKIEELDLEDDEIALSYTYNGDASEYADGVLTYSVNFTLTKL